MFPDLTGILLLRINETNIKVEWPKNNSQVIQMPVKEKLISKGNFLKEDKIGQEESLGEPDATKKRSKKRTYVRAKKSYEDISRIKLDRCPFFPSTEQGKLLLRMLCLQKTLW